LAGLTEAHRSALPSVGEVKFAKLKWEVTPALGEATSPENLAEELQDYLSMIAHGLHAVLAGLPAESAVHRHAKVLELFGGRGVAATQP
jgi:hypothetical protein